MKINTSIPEQFTTFAHQISHIQKKSQPTNQFKYCYIFHKIMILIKKHLDWKQVSYSNPYWKRERERERERLATGSRLGQGLKPNSSKLHNDPIISISSQFSPSLLLKTPTNTGALTGFCNYYCCLWHQKLLKLIPNLNFENQNTHFIYHKFRGLYKCSLFRSHRHRLI